MSPLLAALALLTTQAPGQTEPIRVSLDARGDDVREVLATLFAQAHHPYALDASIKGKLYVALDRMPYAKALGIVLAQANLVAKEKDGVTMISPAPKPLTPVKPVTPQPKIVVPKVSVPAAPVAKIPSSVFAHRVTTRMSRAPLADVFSALGEQAKVGITVDPSVPAYRVDAFFVKTSLRYALDRVCKAAGLRYVEQDGTLVVKKG